MYQSKPTEDSNMRELFEVVPMTTEDGETVNVLKSLGVISLEELQNEKENILTNISNMQTYLAKLEQKILAFGE